MADCTWHILKTEPHKESTVCLALERAGAIVFIPTIYLSKTLSRPQKRFKMVPTPLIPRIVFFQGDLSHLDLEQDRDIRHSQGIVRTNGIAWQVTNAQMIQFREALANDYLADGKWLPMSPDEKRAYKQRQRDRRTVKTLSDLINLTPELFGIEQEIAA